MRSPLSAPSISVLPDLLSSASSTTGGTAFLKPLKLLLYAGSQDFICNGIGVNRTIDKMEWSGGIGWAGTVDGKPVVRPTVDEETDEDGGTVVGAAGGTELEALEEGADTGAREWWVGGRKVGRWRERSGVAFVEFDHAVSTFSPLTQSL